MSVLAGALQVEFSVGPLKVPIIDAVASLLLVVSSLTLLHNQPIAPGQQVALVIAGLAILLRRTWPLGGTALLLVAMVGVVVSGPGVIDCGEILPAAALLAYAGGAGLAPRSSLVALALGTALMCVEMLQDPVMGPGGILVFVPLLVVVWGLVGGPRCCAGALPSWNGVPPSWRVTEPRTHAWLSRSNVPGSESICKKRSPTGCGRCWTPPRPPAPAS